MTNDLENDKALLERAMELHGQVPLIDGHNDLPWRYRRMANRAISAMNISEHQPQLHTDIPRLRQGGVGGQFWSVFVPTSLDSSQHVSATMEQIDLVYNLIRRYPETFQLALDADQVASRGVNLLYIAAVDPRVQAAHALRAATGEHGLRFRRRLLGWVAVGGQFGHGRTTLAGQGGSTAGSSAWPRRSLSRWRGAC
mgnify:CR=1 FL=1